VLLSLSFSALGGITRANQAYRSVTFSTLWLVSIALVGRWSWNAMGLAGFDLHLFQDRTDLYIEWADIMPATIHDKGSAPGRDGRFTRET
jgi:hypothetical protein